ncbi:hypothetical protein Q3G72_019693 [Acer saccharum]|nr:hypothetical protein Q3G72_019693 [Acer saccharum]
MFIMRGIGNQGTHPRRKHLIQQSDTQEEDSSRSDKYDTKDVHSTTPVQTHGRPQLILILSNPTVQRCCCYLVGGTRLQCLC